MTFVALDIDDRIVPRRRPEPIATVVPVQASEFLRNAASLVDGDRAADYGDKVENHENIARLWSAYVAGMPKGAPITAHEVAILMVLMKIARTLLGARSQDTYVDMCGYAAIAGEIEFRARAKTV